MQQTNTLGAMTPYPPRIFNNRVYLYKSQHRIDTNAICSIIHLSAIQDSKDTESVRLLQKQLNPITQTLLNTTEYHPFQEIDKFTVSPDYIELGKKNNTPITASIFCQTDRRLVTCYKKLLIPTDGEHRGHLFVLTTINNFLHISTFKNLLRDLPDIRRPFLYHSEPKELEPTTKAARVT